MQKSQIKFHHHITMEKTAKNIDDWFRSEVTREFNKIPETVRLVAIGNNSHTQIIAESISRKLCFNVKAVRAVVDTLI